MRERPSRRRLAFALVLGFLTAAPAASGALATGPAPVPALGGASIARAPFALADATPTPTPTPAPTPVPSPTPTPAIGSPGSPMSAHLSGDVYGYLPYWEMGGATLDYLDWNALSAISLFSVTWTGIGALDTTQAGYKAIAGPTGAPFVAAAHARGVRVELCFTSFGLSQNASLFTSPALQSTVIAGLRALTARIGADGVNVDVELLSGTLFGAYGSFVGSLRSALRADNPRATVSVATNGNNSGARMAKVAADAGADRIFLMGYGYRSAGSSPGAIAPLDSRGSPGGLDLRWSIDRYALEGVPLGRVILGLPYYGLSWPTTSGALGATKTGSASVYLPRQHLDRPASLSVPLRYEPIESVSWYSWLDTAASTWRQVFYDTPVSLRPKYRLAIDRRLAGVGIWALGYERGATGYWDLLKELFGPPRVATLAALPRLTRSTTIRVAITATPGSRPVTEFRLSRDGANWSPWHTLAAPVTDASGVAIPPSYAFSVASTAPDGTKRAYVQVRDEGGTRSIVRSVSFVLDRTPPVLPQAPQLWFSGTSLTWRARWAAATDLHGPVAYRVQYSVNGSAWRTLAERTTKLAMLIPVRSRWAHVAVLVRPVDVLGNWGAARVTRR